MSKADWRIVIRSHVTGDIKGVIQVLGYETLRAYGFVRNYIGTCPHDIITSGDLYLKDDLKKEREAVKETNTIYIGGTGQLWSTLKSRIEFGHCGREHNESRYAIKCGNSIMGVFPTRHYIDFMVYRKVHNDGRIVIAVFGPSPAGTVWAAKHLEEFRTEIEKQTEYICISQAPSYHVQSESIFKYYR